jgi:endonuclease/exonuclease/phosphatase family metal-dependent hydrolase
MHRCAWLLLGDFRPDPSGTARARAGSSGARACVAAASLFAGCQAPARDCLDQAPPSWLSEGWIDARGALAEGVTPNFRVLTINVGNSVTQAGPYSLRLAEQGYEDRIAAEIQALAPDIVGIQEVAPRAQCEIAAACPVHPDADGFCQAGAGYVCEPLTCTDVDARVDQVQRLLGPDYTILCAGLSDGGISSVDCLGVRIGFGRVVDYHDGSLVPAGAYLPEWGGDVPGEWSFWRPPGFEACDFLAGECGFKRRACDAESSIMWADVVVGPGADQGEGEQMRVVHLHPSALGERCREHQLARAFEAAAARWDQPNPRTLMLGDWNFDPERLVLPVEEALYYAYVGPTRPLHEHDERDSDCARVKTGPAIAGQRPGALDRVVSDFAIGFCQVYNGQRSAMHGTTLPRFDGGQRPSSLPDTNACDCCYAAEIADTAIDHAAVLCDLVWPDAP